MDRRKVARWVGVFSVPVVMLAIAFYRGLGEYPPADFVMFAPGYETVSFVNQAFGPVGLGVATGLFILWAFFFIGPIVRGPI